MKLFGLERLFSSRSESAEPESGLEPESTDIDETRRWFLRTVALALPMLGLTSCVEESPSYVYVFVNSGVDVHTKIYDIRPEGGHIPVSEEGLLRKDEPLLLRIDDGGTRVEFQFMGDGNGEVEIDFGRLINYVTGEELIRPVCIYLLGGKVLQPETAPHIRDLVIFENPIDIDIMRECEGALSMRELPLVFTDDAKVSIMTSYPITERPVKYE